MLCEMPIIGDVWLNRQTLAEIFGVGLQRTEILAAAAKRGQSSQDGHARQVSPSGTLDSAIHWELRGNLDATGNADGSGLCVHLLSCRWTEVLFGSERGCGDAGRYGKFKFTGLRALDAQCAR